MEWIDYRKKLGLGFSDSQKFDYFRIKLFNCIDTNGFLSVDEYFNFCNMVAHSVRELYLNDCYGDSRFSDIIDVIRKAKDLNNLLYRYVAFVNTMSSDTYQNHLGRKYYIDILCKNLDDSHIPFEIVEDDDGFFIFSKGAKELDDALVSQPLEWMNKYPVSRKEFVAALKIYSEVTEENASDIADKFRKVLERFFQEFFGGKRSLENYKSDFGKYLKNRNIPKELANTFENTLDLYCKYINNYAKHGNGVNIKTLEFIMYQTGNIIRLLISLITEEQTNAD